MISKSWARGMVSRTHFVGRFDTLFIRDRGFRFRDFQEDGVNRCCLGAWQSRFEAVVCIHETYISKNLWWT